LEAVADAVRRSRAGLGDESRPIGSFLFLGPTGVGKTELARSLAHFLFDDERAIVRLDMSEYAERHTVARMLGAPPGYVGFEDGGQLTEPVRRRPYSLVLFDEIEKAHSDVWNVLLQVLDEGRLTDGQGRTVDFRNTVMILTSNLGSEFAAEIEQREDLDDQAKQDLLALSVGEEIKKHFRPEFLNRLDDIVTFRRLGREHMRGIVDIQLGRFLARLNGRGLSARISDAAKDLLIESGWDPQYGARPLKRAIVRKLEDPLAKELLAGRFPSGDTIAVDANAAGDELVFSKQMMN
ncbi:MAG: AAA family ATPase, partial [Polyangiaceae bacterium]